MHWTTVTTSYVTMITYPRIIRRERFLANMTMCRVVVCFLLFPG